jgi:hypothetical protein
MTYTSYEVQALQSQQGEFIACLEDCYCRVGNLWGALKQPIECTLVTQM